MFHSYSNLWAVHSCDCLELKSQVNNHGEPQVNHLEVNWACPGPPEIAQTFPNFVDFFIWAQKTPSLVGFEVWLFFHLHPEETAARWNVRRVKSIFKESASNFPSQFRGNNAIRFTSTSIYPATTRAGNGRPGEESRVGRHGPQPSAAWDLADYFKFC